MIKYTDTRAYADPEKAARKLREIANMVEAVQDGRIHIEKINGPFLFKEGGSPGRKTSANFRVFVLPRARDQQFLYVGIEHGDLEDNATACGLNLRQNSPCCFNRFLTSQTCKRRN